MTAEDAVARNVAMLRLYGLMQRVMAAEADPPPVGPDRGVVGLQDALDALVQVAVVIDEHLNTGGIPAERAAFAGAMLMLVREHFAPMPPNAPPGEPDPYTDDVALLVESVRQVGRSPDSVPPDWA